MIHGFKACEKFTWNEEEGYDDNFESICLFERFSHMLTKSRHRETLIFKIISVSLQNSKHATVTCTPKFQSCNPETLDT